MPHYILICHPNFEGSVVLGIADDDAASGRVVDMISMLCAVPGFTFAEDVVVTSIGNFVDSEDCHNPSDSTLKEHPEYGLPNYRWAPDLNTGGTIMDPNKPF